MKQRLRFVVKESLPDPGPRVLGSSYGHDPDSLGNLLCVLGFAELASTGWPPGQRGPCCRCPDWEPPGLIWLYGRQRDPSWEDFTHQEELP